MRRFCLALGLAAIPGLGLAQEATVPENHCGAAAFQGLVGQSAAIARLLVLDQPLRLLPPGTPMSRDLRRERLNIEIDANDIITRIFCA